MQRCNQPECAMELRGHADWVKDSSDKVEKSPATRSEQKFCAVQWTGINTIIFYAPQLFITLGASQRASLAATIVTGIVNHFSTYVSLWAADEFGRRVLFIEGGIQMAIALVGHLIQNLSFCACFHWEYANPEHGFQMVIA